MGAETRGRRATKVGKRNRQSHCEGLVGAIGCVMRERESRRENGIGRDGIYGFLDIVTPAEKTLVQVTMLIGLYPTLILATICSNWIIVLSLPSISASNCDGRGVSGGLSR